MACRAQHPADCHCPAAIPGLGRWSTRRCDEVVATVEAAPPARLGWPWEWTAGGRKGGDDANSGHRDHIFEWPVRSLCVTWLSRKTVPSPPAEWDGSGRGRGGQVLLPWRRKDLVVQPATSRLLPRTGVEWDLRRVGEREGAEVGWSVGEDVGGWRLRMERCEEEVAGRRRLVQVL